MTAPIIRTNETTEASGAVEKALAELRATKANPDNWKWTIISLHNALQGFMVLALKFTNPVLVTRLPAALRDFETEIFTAYNQSKLVKDLPAKAEPEDPDQARDAYLDHAERLAVKHLSHAERRAYYQDTAKRQAWLQSISDSHVWLLDAQLIGFTELFQRLQKKKYKPYTTSPAKFPLPTTEVERHDVARLNQLRNEFIHFTPKSLIIYLDGSGLPRMVFSCANIMLYLVEQGSVLWRILPTDEDADAVPRVTSHLRAMQGEARAIAAGYGTPI